MPDFDINTLTHPHYNRKYEDWNKWRLVAEGGQVFLQEYLLRFTKSEEDDDFKERKKISYCPAFSKSSLREVINSIYQRMSDITRKGGSYLYQETCAGRMNGVDLLGSSMNFFMGTEVLPELLTLGRIGIYVDMPIKQGGTIIENINTRPYLYIYRAEDIRSWDFDESPTPNQFKSVLLRDYVYQFDETTRLPVEQVPRYRFYWMEDGQVFVRFINKDSQYVDIAGMPNDTPIRLKLDRIPFILLELNDSLLTDIADYQIALLNLASADMAYCFGSNFPFYTEQFDPRMDSSHLRRSGIDSAGDSTDVATPSQQINVGPASGRKYPKELDRPGFIHPSSEPMKASMDKQEQLKREIRLLLNLSIANIQPKMVSAESKGMDERTLESGLSYIGLILEDAERQIGEVWRQYENESNAPVISYPKKYNLRSDDDRRKEVSELQRLMAAVPSIQFQREIAKQIVNTLLGDRIDPKILQEIYKEIDNADIINVIPDVIIQAVTGGILDPETAAKALLYPKDVAQKAMDASAKRLAMIQEAQASKNPAARGNPDGTPDPKLAAAAEKTASRDTTTDVLPQDKTRGKGK